MLLHISSYNPKIVYHKEKYMLISDTLSRLSSHNIDASNKFEISSLNINIHDIEVNIIELRVD